MCRIDYISVFQFCKAGKDWDGCVGFGDKSLFAIVRGGW